jgi:hypothetical protein
MNQMRELPSETEVLWPEVKRLLAAFPEEPSKFNQASLSAIGERVFELLFSEGFTEYQQWFRVSNANHPSPIEVQIRVSGDDGAQMACNAAALILKEKWGDAFTEGSHGADCPENPIQWKPISSMQWRLSSSGAIAKRELAAGHENSFNWLFKLGFFGPGYWARLAIVKPDKFKDREDELHRQIDATGLRFEELPCPGAGWGAVIGARMISAPAGVPTVATAAGSDETAETRFANGRQFSGVAPELGPLEKALAMKAKNPEMSHVDIASAVGISRTTLYKPSFRLYRDACAAFASNPPPKGSRAADGSIEAESPDE